MYVCVYMHIYMYIYMYYINDLVVSFQTYSNAYLAFTRIVCVFSTRIVCVFSTRIVCVLSTRIDVCSAHVYTSSVQYTYTQTQP